MINWDQWQTLLTVFRDGTYAKAAKSLLVDSTTIGRRIKTLENRLGYSLFLRHEGRLYPTNECELLLEHVETAYESLRWAEQQSAVAESGTIWRLVRLTAPPFMLNNLYAGCVNSLTRSYRLQMEFTGTGNNLDLSRREADIAIRIEDHPNSIKLNADNVAAEQIGVLEFAVYRNHGNVEQTPPWAGLVDSYVRTTGTEVMHALVGNDQLQYRLSNFDALHALVTKGTARALLPCFIADRNPCLQREGDVALRQPLWMQYHRQDNEVPHLRATREWIAAETEKALVG